MEKLTFYLKWIPEQFMRIYYNNFSVNKHKRWDYNLTGTQEWWKNLVLEDLKKKGFTVDKEGHTKRIGDGEP